LVHILIQGGKIRYDVKRICWSNGRRICKLFKKRKGWRRRL